MVGAIVQGCGRAATAAGETLAWCGRIVAALLRPRAGGRLTVAVDIDCFWDRLTGIGWYLFETLEHLSEAEGIRLRLYGQTVFPYADAPQPTVALPSGSAIELVAFPVPAWIPRRVMARLTPWLEPRVLALQRNAVLFAPNYVLPPKFRLARGAVVVVIHDLAVLRLPSTLRDETRDVLEARLHVDLARARQVITVSQAVRDELLAAEPLDPGRVTAIHHGPGHLSRRQGAALPAWTPERYVLHVGTIEPRKNIELLLRVWEAWTAEDPEAPALVLCGRRGWKSDALHEAFARAAAAGWLRHPGYVDDDTLASLYRKALAVVSPSRYEGFGLPLVEAMAAGTPVVASDIAVFREVAGDAALFLPVDDDAAWKRVLIELAADPALHSRLAARGRERARAFDWVTAASGTRAVLERAARDRGAASSAPASPAPAATSAPATLGDASPDHERPARRR
jgi:alpha-1,3-rhamnosyl/mannosyltransferase